MSEQIINESRTIDVKAYIKNMMDTPRVQALRVRARRCKCKYCGGNLHLKQIVYNNVIEPRIEIFCENCDRIEYGVEPELYQLAKYYVDEFGCDYYPELDASQSKDRMNVAKVSEIMFWALNGLDYLDMEGFKYPYKIDKQLAGESVEIDLDDLDAELSQELKDFLAEA